VKVISGAQILATARDSLGGARPRRQRLADSSRCSNKPRQMGSQDRDQPNIRTTGAKHTARVEGQRPGWSTGGLKPVRSQDRDLRAIAECADAYGIALDQTAMFGFGGRCGSTGASAGRASTSRSQYSRRPPPSFRSASMSTPTGTVGSPNSRPQDRPVRSRYERFRNSSRPSRAHALRARHRCDRMFGILRVDGRDWPAPIPKRPARSSNSRCPIAENTLRNSSPPTTKAASGTARPPTTW